MSVDRVDINSVLEQMRQIRTQMPNASANIDPTGFQNQLQQVSDKLNPQTVNDPLANVANNNGLQQMFDGPATVNEAEKPPGFGDMFKSAIDSVNSNQKDAKDIATRFEKGDPKVDLPEVMIALQKSSVSFQAMTQVRNKMIDAYKDIMNMPL